MAFTGYTNRSERTYITLSSPPPCQNLLQSSFLASSEQSLALCHPLPPAHRLLPLAAFCGSCVINTNLLTWPGFGVQISCTISLNLRQVVNDFCGRFEHACNLLWQALIMPQQRCTHNCTHSHSHLHSLTHSHSHSLSQISSAHVSYT